MAKERKTRSALPGFGLTMGYTLLYLSLIVLIPLAVLVIRSFRGGWEEFWLAATAPRVLASYRLTFLASLIAALVNVVFGFIVAWTLVRYPLPGKKFIDALIDLPFMFLGEATAYVWVMFTIAHSLMLVGAFLGGRAALKRVEAA